MIDTLPRLLADLQRPRGAIKRDYTDFVVEEIPLYSADGTGTHTYFLLEKTGLATQQAVHDLGQALGVPRHAFGVAGLKDSRAVTRQWISVEHIDPERIRQLSIPRLKILDVTRHKNKIRIGHLRSNHFQIKVRETDTTRIDELRSALDTLVRDGVPNYFAEQRFGYRGDTWAIGRALLLNDADAALALILGQPTDADHGAVRQARKLYDLGKYEAALRHWPRIFHAERRALKALVAAPDKRRRALLAIDRRTRNFYVSAYQSYLFNQVIAQRLPAGLGRVEVGDLAWRHANGAVFTVENAEREQPRADALEISPSGPLFGYRMTAPGGAPGEREHDLLAAEGLPLNAFHRGSLRVSGARRPLRFPLPSASIALGADNAGAYLALEFELPRGCYATALLRELFELDQGPDASTPDQGTETPPD